MPRGVVRLHEGVAEVTKKTSVIGLCAVLSVFVVAPHAVAQSGADLTAEQIVNRTAEQVFDTNVLVTLVENVVDQVEPPPTLDVSLEWLGNDFIRLGPGLIHVPYTFSVDREALESGDIALYVRAIDKAAAPPENPDESLRYAWDSIAFQTLDAGNGLTRYMRLEPGEYDVIVAVKRQSTDSAEPVAAPYGLLRYNLSVPDLDSGSLATSSIIRFSEVDQIQGEVTNDMWSENPYIMLPLRLVPVFGSEYPRSQELALAFQIFGYDTGANGLPDVNVEFSITRQTAGASDEVASMMPLDYNASTLPPDYPSDAGLLVANGASLGSLDPGDYQLAITIDDRVADETLVQEVNFTVQ